MDKGKLQQFNRREFLKTGIGLSAGLFMPEAFALPTRLPERTLSFYNTHTGEKCTATYWADGHYVTDEIRKIEWILRDHREGKTHNMDQNLMDLLVVLRHQIDSRRPFHIISGYRTPRTNEMLYRTTSGVDKHSYHMQGRAIDIRLPGFDTRKLRQAARSLKAGGVGYYPHSNFIHIDTGRVRFW
ncbi:MAG TPA: DUF882 domain-containing protein [Gammaproteobacteria bacterium]|nr:DUF882 domain-containing protein [Gammaproteobacteria bacterium]